MELTAAEERKIIDGLTTFIDVIARSIAEHSARVAAEDFQGTPPKRKVERELAKAIFTPQNSDFDEGRGVANYEERKTCSCRCAPEESRATKDFVKSRVLLAEAALFEWGIVNSGKCCLPARFSLAAAHSPFLIPLN